MPNVLESFSNPIYSSWGKKPSNICASAAPLSTKTLGTNLCCHGIPLYLAAWSTITHSTLTFTFVPYKPDVSLFHMAIKIADNQCSVCNMLVNGTDPQSSQTTFAPFCLLLILSLYITKDQVTSYSKAMGTPVKYV